MHINKDWVKWCADVCETKHSEELILRNYGSTEMRFMRKTELHHKAILFTACSSKEPFLLLLVQTKKVPCLSCKCPAGQTIGLFGCIPQCAM